MRSNFARLQQAIGVLLLCFSLTVQAQMKVGQPAGSPDPSAALDVSGGPYTTGSTYRGIAPPKVALTQTSLAAPINSPATGLLVYNTAKVSDVTPGYYYWEGSKWARLSTVNFGAARMSALSAGDPLPEYTITQVRSWTTAPSSYSNASPAAFMLVDEGKQGLFRYDPSDTTTPDNTGRILVTTSGLRYKRVIEGGVLHMGWYGNLVESDTNDVTTMLQAAVDDAVKVANPGTFGPFKNYSGNPGTVLIPPGDFFIQSSININGSIRIKGQSGGTYAGSRLVQKKNGISIFLLGGDTDGGANSPNKGSNSTVIEDLMFQSGSSTIDNTVAQIKVRSCTSTTNCVASNSVYIRNCWFQSAEYSAIWLPQGDDIQITGCTFDVLAFDAIRLGDNATGGIVQNCRITNNTFFEVRQNTIKIQKAKAVVIANNSAYYVGDSPWANSVFINTQDATLSQGIAINANTVELLSVFSILEAGATNDISISNNTVSRMKNSFILFTSANTAINLKVTNNTISSLNAWGAPPLNFHYSGLTNSIITNNTIINTVSSTTLIAIDAPNSQVTGNIIRDNIFTGFAVKPNNFTSELANGVTRPENQIAEGTGISGSRFIDTGNLQTISFPKSTFFRTTNAVAGVPYAGDWLGTVVHNEDVSGSGGGPYYIMTITDLHASYSQYNAQVENGVFKGWYQVSIAPPVSSTISTSGWNTSTWYAIKAPDNLPSGYTYEFKLQFDKSGTDNIVVDFTVPIMVSVASSTPIPINATNVSYGGYTSNRHFDVQTQPGLNGQTLGVYVKMSNADMAGGLISITWRRKL